MITLFIFKSNSRGMQYGIGTYIKELTDTLLKAQDIKVFIVSYNNHECRELSVKAISDRLIKIFIPSPSIHSPQNNSFEQKYASTVIRLLSDYIPQNDNVVFQMNYIDDLAIAKGLKEKYDYPVISIVHFAQWQQIFEGNRKKVAGLDLGNPSNNIEFTLSKEREMYSISDHIVSVTRYMKQFLVNEYAIQPYKITVIHNGLALSNYDPVSGKERIEIKKKLGFAEDEVIILFSGRIDPCKGIVYLMGAFEEACKKYSNLRLILMGQGSIQDCQKLLHSSYGKVTYTGFLTKELVSLFYKVADIGIVPSIYDHCPYTVLEMMANRIPLIASRIKGLNEILDDNCCLFVDPVINKEGDISFNINELSDAILTMAKKNSLRTKLAVNSYNKVSRKYGAFQMAEEMNNIFHTLTINNKLVLEYEKNERG